MAIHQVVFNWAVMKYYAIIDQSKRFKYDSVLHKRILNKGLQGEDLLLEGVFRYAVVARVGDNGADHNQLDPETILP